MVAVVFVRVLSYCARMLDSDIQSVAGIFRLSAERFGDLPAFATRLRGGRWQPLSFRDLYERGRTLAIALMELGVRKGDAVGIISDNRAEWILAEAGIQLCGGISTPRGTDVTDADLAYMLDHAEIRICLVESPRELERVYALTDQLPCLEHLVLLSGEADGVLSLAELELKGRDLLAERTPELEEREASIGPDDLFTLIYTSGTTGKPKGVMLTHANMLSQVRNVPLQLTCTDRVLSILPIWHVFERMFEMYTISQGVCSYYTSPRTLAQDLLDVEPTFMGSAPRLWESLHDRILDGIRQAHPMRRFLFRTARLLAHLHHGSMAILRNETPKRPRGPTMYVWALKVFHLLRVSLLLPFYGFFNASVLEAVRQKAGGSLKATISGGGALPTHIDEFFTTLGIQVLEGYGLTETSPVLAVRVSGKRVRGTVGPVIPNTEVRIVDMESNRVVWPDPERRDQGCDVRGEIQVRGPQIMKGYRKDPELTRTVLSEDGWFRTGDLGCVTWNGCLKILGRAKSTIVLSNGENVEPEPIEARLTQCPHIDRVYLCGQDRKHLGALVVPDLQVFRAKNPQIHSLAEIERDEEARRRILNEIRHVQAHAGDPRFARVQVIALLPSPFTVGEELTNLHKLKRHVIENKYAGLIRSLFESPPEVRT